VPPSLGPYSESCGSDYRGCRINEVKFYGACNMAKIISLIVKVKLLKAEVLYLTLHNNNTNNNNNNNNNLIYWCASLTAQGQLQN